MDTPGSIAGTVRATTGPREGYAFRVLDGDLIRLAGATLSLLGLGVVMGISPTLIAVTLRVLTEIPRPNRPIGFMLVGLTAGSTALLLVLQIVDPRNFEALLKHGVEGVLVRRSVDLTAGALFLIASVFMWIRARTPHRPKAPKRPPTGSPWEMVLIGAPNAVVSVSGVATMYLTARLIRGASDNDILRVAGYAIFVLALVSPYVLLAWVWERFPRVSGRLSAFFGRLAAADLRPAEAALTSLVGVIFLGLGRWG